MPGSDSIFFQKLSLLYITKMFHLGDITNENNKEQ